MVASRFNPPYQYASGSTGEPIPGALLFFYLNGSTTPAETYADAGLTVPNSNPVVANANGIFPDIFLAADIIYTAVLAYPPVSSMSPVIIWTANNVTAGLNETAAVAASNVTATDNAGGTLWQNVQGFINYLENSVSSAALSFTQNTALSASQLGGWGIFTNQSVQVTLPLLSTTNAKQPFMFLGGANGGTIVPAGNDTITAGNGSLVTSLTIGAGEIVVLTSGGSGTSWYVTSDSIAGSSAPASGSSGVKVLASGVSNYTVAVTANSIILSNAAFAAFAARSVNVSAALNTSGANGLDTGSPAASTWYNVFVIYDPTSASTAALLSLSATAPALPSGYTFFARVGAVRTDSSTSYFLLPSSQFGRSAQWMVTSGGNLPELPIIASGASGSPTAPTWTAFPVAAYTPPTASAIKLVLGGAGTNSGAMAAPNNAYGAYTSTTNPPPLVWSNDANGQNACIPGVFNLESANIYYASGGGYVLACLGWEDNL